MNEEDIRKIRERLEGLAERERLRVQHNYSTDKRHLIELSQRGSQEDSRDYERVGKMVSDYRHFVSTINFVYSAICGQFNLSCEPIKLLEINQGH